jgi:hypothetical protein
MARIAKTYDPACYELATSFLEDSRVFNDKRCDELARLIQQTIEDYIAHEERNYEPSDQPGFEGGFAANH